MSTSPETPQPNPSDQAAAPAPDAPQHGAPQHGAPQHGAPQYGAPQYGAPGAAPYAAPAPEQGTNGLAIAGLILAFLIAPVGFVLSIIALIQTRKRQQKGRGLAIAGVIVSVLSMLASIAIVVAIFATVGKNVATVTDPGCVSGKEAITKAASAPTSTDPDTTKAQLQAAVDELNAAAAKAEHDNVRQAMKALADDYSAIVTAINTGTTPASDLMDKVETDANKIDELCTIGGAGK
ncbi:DUF4190 domain-containing protein [Planosporangium mesophilum]|uniref:DUF4190 domain-containing protein n=1 Tax=Planosporangium mesophilum TaxID=689768 RepID=A0A8J3TEY9_9ACTN|nr:DUF4190 domain-containing protein [Planosporangium mesophilum]NJC82005.1 DUF4190 domain-containing protein [Planosporangium mesophilum]GII25228.1 hypothetical protein Pme01_48250 [Planosporangium mesophilum]